MKVWPVLLFCSVIYGCIAALCDNHAGNTVGIYGAALLIGASILYAGDK